MNQREWEPKDFEPIKNPNQISHIKYLTHLKIKGQNHQWETFQSAIDQPNALRIRITLEAKKHCQSHIVIERQFPRNPSEHKENQSKRANFKITLDNNGNKQLNASPLDKVPHQFKQHLPNYKSGSIYLAEAQILTGKRTTQGFTNGWSNKYNKTMEALTKTSTTTDKKLVLILHIKGGHKIMTDIEQINKRIEAEQVSNPLAQWHTAHPCHYFVQYKELTSTNKQPQEHYLITDVYSNFNKYATYMGYGVIQED